VATSREGFTLLEVLLALSIAAAVLAVTFGGLRAGVGAWAAGRARADEQQHARSLAFLIQRTLMAAQPYLEPVPGGQPLLRFEGEPWRLAFVTAEPPSPVGAPVAFTAVVLRVDAGLGIYVRPLPNADPFATEAPAVVDPAVTGLRFRYLREPTFWEEAWDGARERRLPRAVEVTLTTTAGGRAATHAPVVVPVPAGWR
jgi:general secretion pathway protein J